MVRGVGYGGGWILIEEICEWQEAGMESARSGLGVQHRSLCPQKDPNFYVGAATGIPVLLGRLAHPPNIAYRCVQPSDLEILQEIHEALFPIKYELEFFMSVVHGKGIVAWAAVDTSRSDGHGDLLVGFVTARIIKATDAEGEDILGYDVLKADRSLLYILTLGVVKPYRNFGIASALVWQVIEYARRIPSCRAVYLHVIAYNRAAINFYQKNTFRCLRRLSKFYHINGHHYDAYLYIYYVNGGRSPCSALDFVAGAGNFLKNAFTALVESFCRQRNESRSKLMGP